MNTNDMRQERICQDRAYRQAAHRLYAKPGVVDVDETASVSVAASDGRGTLGAYVEAWVWVPKDALNK